MTNQETANHIRKFFKSSHSHPVWGWPTDGCSYEQHINFVQYLNKYWTGVGFKEFEIFALDYANKLEKFREVYICQKELVMN